MSVNGRWSILLELASGNHPAELELHEDGPALQGKMITETGAQEFNGSVEGDSVSWTVNQATATGVIGLVFEGLQTADRITGTVEIPESGAGGTFVANRLAA